MLLDRIFSTAGERRLAREEARYAVSEHDMRAEEKLREMAQRARSRSHRRIYRLAIAELRRLQG